MRVIHFNCSGIHMKCQVSVMVVMDILTVHHHVL
jgi:hypothetical protein